MRSVLLVAAASLASILISPAPGSAQAFSEPMVRNGPSAPAGPFVRQRSFSGVFAPGFGCDGRDRRGHDGRRRAVFDGCAAFGAAGYFDEDINRDWDSDSFNDWWHDRPDRAYPRWISHNDNCTPDRMWWSGSGWHC
jgi:hypothetical protein